MEDAPAKQQSHDPEAGAKLRRWKVTWFIASMATMLGLVFVTYNLVTDRADIVVFATFFSYLLVLAGGGTSGGPVRALEPRPDEVLLPPRR